MDYYHYSDSLRTSQVAKSLLRDEADIMIHLNLYRAETVVVAIKVLHKKSIFTKL